MQRSQAAFTFSDDLHPQRLHNQLKHIGMPAAAGVIEVKRIVSHSILRQQLDQLSRIENGCDDDMRHSNDNEVV